MSNGLQLRDRLDHAWHQLIGIGFAVAEVIVVFVIANLLARSIRRLIRRRLRNSPMPQNAKILLENLSTVATYLGGLTVLLALWNVTWSALLAAISAGTIVIALGFQAILQSVVGGIFILFERPFTIGDRIQVANQGSEGVVEEIGLRTTVIRSDDGDRIVVPNSLIFTNAMGNLTPNRSWRTTVTVRWVDVRADVARERVEAALAATPGFTATPEITVRSYLARLKRRKAPLEIPVIGDSAGRLMQKAVSRTTYVKISWTGVGDRKVRDELIRQLEERFPDAAISVRRY